MATITKKELIDRIADRTGSRRVLVKKVVQQSSLSIASRPVASRTACVIALRVRAPLISDTSGMKL